MGIEIERKFLVTNDSWKNGSSGTEYRQGYMGGMTRVRIAGEKGFLTIKGDVSALTRREFEYEIPRTDAEELLVHFCPACVEKTRYRILHAGHIWEVDVFHGVNAPLVVAEVELESEEEEFVLPDWVGRDVSGDARYRNSMLVQQPYSLW